MFKTGTLPLTGFLAALPFAALAQFSGEFRIDVLLVDGEGRMGAKFASFVIPDTEMAVIFEDGTTYRDPTLYQLRGRTGYLAACLSKIHGNAIEAICGSEGCLALVFC